MNYGYNEAKMMAGIREFREEQKNAPLVIPIHIQTAKAVIERTAERFQVPPDSIISRSREAHLVRAREVVVLILRRQYGYSLTRIGIILRRHHTSIMYMQKLGDQHYEGHPNFRNVVDSLYGPISAKIMRDELGIPIGAA